jgi:hypothetical protein
MNFNTFFQSLSQNVFNKIIAVDICVALSPDCSIENEYQDMEAHDMKPKIIIIIGGLVLVAAVILGVVAAVYANQMFSTSIPDEAEYVVNAPGNVTLEEGDYEIWVKMDPETVREDWDNVEIEIFDDNEDRISQRKGDFEKNIADYYSYGELTIEADGVYNFRTDSERKVYITEPMDDWGGEFMICMVSLGSGLCVGFIGLALLVIGIIMVVARRNSG